MDQLAPENGEPKQIPSAPPLSPELAEVHEATVTAPSAPLTAEQTITPSNAEASETPLALVSPESETPPPDMTVVPSAAEPNPLPFFTPPPKKRRLLRAVVILVVMLNLGLAGASGWLTFHKPKTAAASTLATSAQPVATGASDKSASTATAKPAGDATTLHYVSDALKLEFDYPVDWRVSSSADNSSVSLRSAPFHFTSPDGQLLNAALSVTITPVSTASYVVKADDSYVITNNSQSLVYSNPTKQQRSTTNVSFASYPENKAGTTTAIFISGNLSYNKGDTVGSKNYKSIDPKVYLELDGCASSGCADVAQSNAFTSSDWQSVPTFQQAKSLFESLRFN